MIYEKNRNWKFDGYTINNSIDWELLTKKYSWLEQMKGTIQDPIWHAEGDVYIHTKMVIEKLIDSEGYKELNDLDKHILFTAALMHDVEKPNTTRKEIREGVERVVSPNHAKYGENFVRTYFYMNDSAPFSVREHIAKLVRHHGLPLFVLTKRDPQKEVIKASMILDTKLLYLLTKADIKGRYCNDKEELLLNVELFKELCIENDCFGKKKEFKTDHARFNYFYKKDVHPDFMPYDNMDFEVTVMSAVAGSGKDHYIKNHTNLPMLSLDDIRRKHRIKRGDKKGHGQMIQEAKELAKVFMRKKQSFVFNATNISRDMREKWIQLFLDYNAQVKIIYLEVPYKTLLSQNSNREYALAREDVDKMIKKVEVPDVSEAHIVEFHTK